MLAAYGGGLAGITYDDWFALWLNRYRVMQRRAAEVAMGIGLALGGKPDSSFFDALADDAEEATRAERKFEADSREQAAIERHKFK